MTAENFLAEIREQADMLERLLGAYSEGTPRAALQEAAALLRRSQSAVCLTGMGASLFALLPAKAWLDVRGVSAWVEDTAYLVEYGRTAVPAGAPLVLISQSGQTFEANELVALGPRKGPVILVTNSPDGDLARSADIVLPLFAGGGRAAALQTYCASVVVALMLAAETYDGSSASIGAELLQPNVMKASLEVGEQCLANVMKFVEGASYVVSLGRGPSLASALETALLMKEVAKLPVEGGSAPQFRHGSVEIIETGSVCVLFAPDGSTAAANARLADELESYGARLLIVAGRDWQHTTESRMVIKVESPNEFVAPALEIVPLQFLSCGLALARGLDPQYFRNTTPVITSA